MLSRINQPQNIVKRLFFPCVNVKKKNNNNYVYYLCLWYLSILYLYNLSYYTTHYFGFIEVSTVLVKKRDEKYLDRNI